jgi:hypothetical protein
MLYTITKDTPDGNRRELCGTACHAIAFYDEGIMVGCPFASDSKPAEFVPNMGMRVIFISTKMDAGYVRTSTVKEAEKVASTWIIKTLNSIYRATEVANSGE